MSNPGELRVPVLPSGTRRRLVHGGFIAIALLYVGILVIAPLIGIAWAVFQAGWSTIVSTLRQPDVQHAFYLTGVITVITVVYASGRPPAASRSTISATVTGPTSRIARKTPRSSSLNGSPMSNSWLIRRR